MSFASSDHEIWRRLYGPLARCRREQAHPAFAAGLDALGITGDAVPDLAEVNVRLGRLTGWRGVLVAGLEGPQNFFAGLARREFPIGNFIRDASDLSYTPAPDVFHDLYGHMPLLADPSYAEFCQQFGAAASRFAADAPRLRQYERLFWFGVEFPLIETEHGRRIFGGGILSSLSECDYSLSAAPEVQPFDLEVIRRQEFRIDELQRRLFVVKDRRQLFTCLPRFAALVASAEVA